MAQSIHNIHARRVVRRQIAAHNPRITATSNDSAAAGRRSPACRAELPAPMKLCVSHAITGIATATPADHPPTASATDFAHKNRQARVWRVNPSVFSTATSRVRLRIDIAIVFAETSMIANTTAPQMLRMNALTFPSDATNPS